MFFLLSNGILCICVISTMKTFIFTACSASICLSWGLGSTVFDDVLTLTSRDFMFPKDFTTTKFAFWTCFSLHDLVKMSKLLERVFTIWSGFFFLSKNVASLMVEFIRCRLYCVLDEYVPSVPGKLTRRCTCEGELLHHHLTTHHPQHNTTTQHTINLNQASCTYIIINKILLLITIN